MKTALPLTPMLTLICGVVLTIAGCHPALGSDDGPGQWRDEPLADYRIELLDTAFDVASRIPVEPHRKTRSRQQYEAVALSLELDQPRRALSCIERMENWEQGAGYADLAFYLVRKGHADKVAPFLERAAAIAQTCEADWRRDRIRAKIARTYAWRGAIERAEQLERGLEPSEVGQVAQVKAMRCADEAFEAQMDALGQLIATGGFDGTNHALAAHSLLFDRFYDDAGRRERIETAIKASWGTLPLSIRITTLLTLAETAVSHSDRAKALALVEEAQQIVDDILAASIPAEGEDASEAPPGGCWSLRHRIPVTARVAAMRARAGDTDRARHDTDALLDLYQANDQWIVDIDRAEALRSVAEAYQALGDAPAALAVYTLAVEVGVVNPNSRPRAEDLAATCRSMARHGVKPDADLWSRIRQIKGALGTPW